MRLRIPGYEALPSEHIGSSISSKPATPPLTPSARKLDTSSACNGCSARCDGMIGSWRHHVTSRHLLDVVQPSVLARRRLHGTRLLRGAPAGQLRGHAPTAAQVTAVPPHAHVRRVEQVTLIRRGRTHRGSGARPKHGSHRGGLGAGGPRLRRRRRLFGRTRPPRTHHRCHRSSLCVGGSLRLASWCWRRGRWRQRRSRLLDIRRTSHDSGHGSCFGASGSPQPSLAFRWRLELARLRLLCVGASRLKARAEATHAARAGSLGSSERAAPGWRSCR